MWDFSLDVESCQMGERKADGELARCIDQGQAELKLASFRKDLLAWAVIERKSDGRVAYEVREIPRGAPRRIESGGEDLRVRKTCGTREEAEEEADRLSARAARKGQSLPVRAEKSAGRVAGDEARFLRDSE